jgi:hypothetical protein
MALQQRNRATHARSEAERLIEFMLFDLRDKSRRSAGSICSKTSTGAREILQAFPSNRTAPDGISVPSLSGAADYLRRRGDSPAALRSANDSWQIAKRLADDSRERRSTAASGNRHGRSRARVSGRGDLALADARCARP